MTPLFRGSTFLILWLWLNAATADDRPAVTPFEADGVVADVAELFPIAATDGKRFDRNKTKPTLEDVAARAFVTEKGVYAFLETPENKQALKTVKLGTSVTIKGRLLASGALLHIDSLSTSAKESGVNLARYANERGDEVALRGVNKCQCGLNVADLPHNCTLGHLHHLEADDGKIYHYLQYGDGTSAFLGKGSHFRNVEVKARLFPGQFLLVEKGKLTP